MVLKSKVMKLLLNFMVIGMLYGLCIIIGGYRCGCFDRSESGETPSLILTGEMAGAANTIGERQG